MLPLEILTLEIQSSSYEKPKLPGEMPHKGGTLADAPAELPADRQHPLSHPGHSSPVKPQVTAVSQHSRHPRAEEPPSQPTS